MSEPSSKKNIAVLLPTFSHSVEYNFALGVRAGLPADQYNVLYMTVGWIESETEGKGLAAYLHQSLNFEDLDGMILYSAGITNRATPESIREITDLYPDIPIINAGNIVEGLPSVIFNNRIPFRQFVDHLVAEKQCSRIAWVGGPEHNYDAIERRQGFLEGLAQNGLTLPEEYDWPGLFSIASGSFAVKQHYASLAHKPEAIICANDLSALGVINELLALGLNVPEDVMVVGFDDLEYSKEIRVPLTTGRYPVYDMGEASAENMIHWLNGKTPASQIEVGTSVIFRSSTGDSGDPRSQIALRAEPNRAYYSRDSNSDRLHINQAINSGRSIARILPSISTNIYDVGCRQLLYFEVDPHDFSIVDVSLLDGYKFSKLPKDDPLRFGLNLTELFERLPHQNLNWVLSAVQANEHFFGYVLTAVTPYESDFSEYIANEFSKKNENILLSSEFEKLRQQVLRTEQMATLGRLVSGLAHEINTPLGISLVAATNLADEIQKIRRLEKDKAMTRSAFNQFLENCDETQSILFSSLKRSADLVSSFKQVSVDQHSDENRIIDLAHYLNEVLVSLKPKIKHSNVDVFADFDSEIVINTNPGTWAQLLTNLILNAIIHGFNDGQDEGEIHLRLSGLKDRVELIVSDNGVGIEKKVLHQIFDPFFTTRRAKGGTGLGLHIVYNMVSQKLMGHIDVHSHQTSHNRPSGTTFTITVPRQTSH